MDFIFFSNLKKKINIIQTQLLEIKSIYNILFYNIIHYPNDIESEFIYNENNICHHTFIDDSIDIDCEKSQNIRYCSICYYTVA